MGYSQAPFSQPSQHPAARNADVEWGRIMGERPYFEKEGMSRHPNGPYTIESVRNSLLELLKQLAADNR